MLGGVRTSTSASPSGGSARGVYPSGRHEAHRGTPSRRLTSRHGVPRHRKNDPAGSDMTPARSVRFPPASFMRSACSTTSISSAVARPGRPSARAHSRANRNASSRRHSKQGRCPAASAVELVEEEQLRIEPGTHDRAPPPLEFQPAADPLPARPAPGAQRLVGPMKGAAAIAQDSCRAPAWR